MKLSLLAGGREELPKQESSSYDTLSSLSSFLCIHPIHSTLPTAQDLLPGELYLEIVISKVDRIHTLVSF